MEVSNTQWNALIHFVPNVKLFAGARDITRQFIVDPALDLEGIDSNTHFVPTIVIEVTEVGGLVFASISSVDATQANDATSPTPEDEAGVVFSDWKG